MILTQPFLKDINEECRKLQAKNQKPIIYISANNLHTLTYPQYCSTPILNTEGYAGTLWGVPVYVTDEVLDLIIIVPQLTEENK